MEIAHRSCWSQRIAKDRERFIDLKACNVIVANGRYYGGGMRAAPRASWNDGRLDVLAVRAVRPADVLALLLRARGGLPTSHRDLIFARARRVEVGAGPPAPVEVDGDVIGTTPIPFEIGPDSLRLVIPGSRP